MLSVGGGDAGDPRLREVDFTDTGQPGAYTTRELDANGSAIGEGKFVINAGHRSESNLTANPELAQTVAAAEETADVTTTRRVKEIWPAIVLAVALAIFGIELLVILLRGSRGVRRAPRARNGTARA